MKTTKAFPAYTGWVAWSLWTAGVLLLWFGGVTGDAWRLLFSLSLLCCNFWGFIVFYFSVRRHRPTATTDAKGNAWMNLVACATLAFLVTLVANGWMALHQAIYGASPPSLIGPISNL